MQDAGCWLHGAGRDYNNKKNPTERVSFANFAPTLRALRLMDFLNRTCIIYFLKILAKNTFMSFHESLSASALYAIGRLNFLPVSVEAGFVNACIAFG